MNRRALVTLSTGTGESPVHSRGWEVPADDPAMEKFAQVLTYHFGNPMEWVTDDSETPGQVSVLFFRE